MFRSFLVVLCLVLLTFTIVQAQTSDAQNPYDITALEHAANNGDVDAQLNLAYIYGIGQYKAQDYVRARKYFRMAADQGNADAQFNLGMLFANGQGIKQDFAEAYFWLHLSSNAGYEKGREMAILVSLELSPSEVLQELLRAAEWSADHK